MVSSLHMATSHHLTLCKKPILISSQSYNTGTCTVPKVIDFPRYNMKCSGDNVDTTRNISCSISFSSTFHVYRGNLDYFMDSVLAKVGFIVYILYTIQYSTDHSIINSTLIYALTIHVAAKDSTPLQQQHLLPCHSQM